MTGDVIVEVERPPDDLLGQLIERRSLTAIVMISKRPRRPARRRRVGAAAGARPERRPARRCRSSPWPPTAPTQRSHSLRFRHPSRSVDDAPAARAFIARLPA